MMIPVEHCPITRNVPISALAIFSVSLIIFVYIYVTESAEEKQNRTTSESIWITLFFILLITCIVTSGVCVLAS